jgi:hypothetical protein
VAAHFPYWSIKQVERLLKKLTDRKILIKGNYNKLKFDRTVWYAFGDESGNGVPKSGNGNSDIGIPIPDTKPDTKPIEKEIYKEKPPAPEEKIAYGEHVKLRPSEYQALEAKQGKTALDEMIARINDYLASTGIKPYKDYAATIRNWFRREKRTPAGNNDLSDSKAKNLKAAWKAKDYLESVGGRDLISIGDFSVKLPTGDSISLSLLPENFGNRLAKEINLISNQLRRNTND